MSRSFAVILAAGLLAFAACGDDGGGGKSSVSAYCDQLEASAKEASAPTTTTPGPTTSINYKDVEKRFDVAFEKISSKAPSELEDDYAIVQEYFQLYLKALGKDPAADTKKLTELGPKYRTSQETIAKYNKDTCKFEVTTTTPSAPKATTPTTAAK